LNGEEKEKMKIQPYVERLEKSKEYKDFRKEHKSAFLSAGFFVLDFEEKKNVHQLDFYVPNKNKMAAFTLDNGIKMQLLDLVQEKTPEKLDIKVKTDLDALYGILEDEMKNRNMTENIKKIVAVLQNIDGKRLWNLTCILSGMEILRSHVDDETRSVLKMEKFSMMDLMKKVPGKALANMPALKQGLKPAVSAEVDEDGEVSGSAPVVTQAPKIEDQIKQINKIEEVLEKKKKELEGTVKKEKALEKEKEEFEKLEKSSKKGKKK
jgi:hypothetical protein